MPDPIPSELRDAVAELTHAGMLSFGPSGFAAMISPALQAFHTLLEAGAEARGSAEWLLEHADPAGRVYAATVLAACDDDAGSEVWRRLSADEGTFLQLSGCLGRQRTVADHAREQLARQDG